MNAVAQPSARRSAGMPRLLRRFKPIDVLPLVVLVGMVVYFSLAANAFLTTQNLTLITGQAGTLLLAALGATLVVVMGSVDLSIGSIVLLTGTVIGKLLSEGSHGVILIIVIALAIGAAAGLVNGLAFSYGRVPSFIVTLGTLSLFSGLALTIIDGKTVSFIDPSIQNLAIGQLIPNVQNIALFGLGALAVVWVLARRTKFGMYLYAMGGNERVVALSGIRVKRYKTMAFVLSGVTAALAGLLLTAQLGSAGSSLGTTTLLDALAAIVVGGTALSGGVGGVHRTLLGVQDFTQTMIKGGVIVVAALFTMASQRRMIVK